MPGSRTRSILTAGALALLAGLPAVVSRLHAGADSPPARQTRPTEPEASAQEDREAPPVLRGSGIMILDPRDEPEEITRRFREFLIEARSGAPRPLGNEDMRRQIDALLAGPIEEDRLPQLSLVFAPGVTRSTVLRTLEGTPSAAASREVCPRACPVAAMFSQGFHLHLTRAAGSLGDSILAIDLDAGREGAGEPARLAEAQRRRQSLLERYPDLGPARRPVARLFGVGIFLGEPALPDSALTIEKLD